MCRELSVDSLSNHQCGEKCPDNLFKYHRRCVTAKQCWNISKPFARVGYNVPPYPFIPFNGTCTSTCPKHYEPDGQNGARTCKSCNGECKRECNGGIIDSISAAQNYRGCAIITGTLIIQIRQGERKWRILFRTSSPFTIVVQRFRK